MDIKNLLCSSSNVLNENDANDFPKSPIWSSSSSTSTFSSSSSSTANSPVSSCFSTPPSSPSVNEQQQQQRPSSQPQQQPRQSQRTPQTRTPWTAEEDYLLQQGYTQGLSWAMISAKYLPHRSRGCCWGRFKTLQTKAMEHREWTSTEDRLLLMAVKKHSRLFKQAWKSVAEDLPGRSWRECEFRTARMIRKKQQH
ncbi:hypothetical protein RO3G_00935 [Lichtheimia corymbifera JMRC:FSU:9682]|uniref:Myb-like domain-containing protein n=1 Tax=Lichtheimia corymbifera JMRC:FSU:9682 TaxID=1263082 RepID=A0A068RFV1_9FUNG|nr:hypothetical protein RO3G_00935 [Lichtheimia corymbifera JMRC:FSU:9682]